MREENIKQAVAFLQKKGDSKAKEIPMEEKLKFLEGRLTEEELGEVRKRVSETSAAGTTNGATSTSAAVVATKSRDSVMQNVRDSPVAE